MTEASAPNAAGEPPRAATAGGLLRQARQARGLHIAALAAAIKVVPHKLELLESDRLDELPDATFARALAQSVCRVLKIDAAPVLELLPPLPGHRLERVAQGLNTPFHEDHDGAAGSALQSIASPALWGAGLLVVAAIVVYVLPNGWLPFARPASTPTTQEIPVVVNPSNAATSATTPATTPAPDAQPTAAAAPQAAASLPAVEADAASADAATSTANAGTATLAPGVQALKISASARSWLQIVDANGQVLIARVLETGETVAFDARMPLKLTIGNVGATRVTLRGEPVALAPHTSGNVARFEVE